MVLAPLKKQQFQLLLFRLGSYTSSKYLTKETLLDKQEAVGAKSQSATVESIIFSAKKDTLIAYQIALPVFSNSLALLLSQLITFFTCFFLSLVKSNSSVSESLVMKV